MEDITVYYDGKCPLCRREINIYKSLSGSTDVSYIDIEAVNFDYANKLTAVNAINLASLGWSPIQPKNVKIGGAVKPSTTLKWDKDDDPNIKGYKIYNTKMAPLADGKYRTFIVIEFPVSLAYRNFIANIDDSVTLKAEINKLKSTDAFKELEQYVSEFTGA